MTVRWPLGAVLAAAPALLAVPLFEAAHGFEVLSPAEIEEIREALGLARHPKGIGAFVAFVVWHVGLCAAAAALALGRIAALPEPLRRNARVVAAALAVVASIALVAVGASGAALARLTHGLPAALMGGSALGPSWPSWALLVPSVLGIAKAALVASAAHAEVMARLPRGRGRPEDDAVAEAASSLRMLLRALSLVLASSAVGATLYFHLPSELYALGGGPVDDGILDRLLLLAGEMSLFWAAIYTATLFGAVGVPLLVAGWRAGGVRDLAPRAAFGASMALLERGAVMLAPLLSALAARSLDAAGLGG